MVEMDEDDALLPVAAQTTATTILGPCAIGWSLAVFFGGMATALGCSLLLDRTVRVGRLSKPLLALAMLFNLASIAVNICETWEYMTRQLRSTTSLNAYTLADCLAPLFACLAAATCQTFMGIRCVRISGSNIILSIVISLGILSSLGGAVWLTVANVLYMRSIVGPGGLLIPTELWLWGAVATDLLLTAVLTWSLRKMRKGFNQSTDDFINALIQLSFGTCALPLIFSVFTAATYAATYNDPLLWNMFNASAPAIPSLYVISFCYCLRGSAASHQHMESRSFEPVSGKRQGSNIQSAFSFKDKEMTQDKGDWHAASNHLGVTSLGSPTRSENVHRIIPLHHKKSAMFDDSESTPDLELDFYQAANTTPTRPNYNRSYSRVSREVKYEPRTSLNQAGPIPSINVQQPEIISDPSLIFPDPEQVRPSMKEKFKRSNEAPETYIFGSATTRNAAQEVVDTPASPVSSKLAAASEVLTMSPPTNYVKIDSIARHGAGRAIIHQDADSPAAELDHKPPPLDLVQDEIQSNYSAPLAWASGVKVTVEKRTTIEE